MSSAKESPTPDQLKAAHQVAADAAEVAAAFPPAEVWQREFPECYTETPDGKFNVNYRNQKNTAEQNERNSQKMLALTADWAKKSTETSMRRMADVDTVRVRGMDGVVMNVPARLEQKMAQKGKVKPVVRWGRGTRYWTDKDGSRWKRRHGGEWEPDRGQGG